MKENYFIIMFTNVITVFATALHENEAIILSQAVLIKNGYIYEVQSVKETKDMLKMSSTNFIV